jgi:hypothetical protein
MTENFGKGKACLLLASLTIDVEKGVYINVQKPTLVDLRYDP